MKLIVLILSTLLLLVGCCKNAEAVDYLDQVRQEAMALTATAVGSAVGSMTSGGVVGGVSIICHFNVNGLCPGNLQPAQYLAKELPGAKLKNVIYLPTYAVIQYQR